MVDTRFDRGVYEDDDNENSSSSGSGGGGGSNSDSSQSSSNIIDKDVIAPNRPGNDEEPVSDKERIAPEAPNQDQGSEDRIIIDTDDGPLSDIDTDGGGGGGGSSTPDSPPSKDTIAPNQQPGGPGDPIDPDQASSERLQKAQESTPKASPQAQRNREELERQQKAAEFKERSRQTLTEIEEAENDVTVRFGDKELTGEQGAELIDQQVQETNRFQEQSLERFKENEARAEQSSVDIARVSTGVASPLTAEGLQDTVESPGQQALITGVGSLQTLEDSQDEIVELIPDSQDTAQIKDNVISETGELLGVDEQQIDTLQQAFPESSGFSLATGADNEIAVLGETSEAAIQATREDEELDVLDTSSDIIASGSDIVTTPTEEKASANIAAGTATGLPVLGSFGAATVGGTVTALDEDTPSLAEGAAQGPALVGQDFERDPTEFVSREVGEEVGETVGTLGVGAALPTVTPEFTPKVSSSSQPSALDRGVAAALPGNEVLIVDTDTQTTPDFVNEPGSPTQPEADTSVTDIDVTEEIETSGRQSVDTTTQSGSTNKPVVDAISRPSSLSEPQSISQSRPESDILGEPRTQSTPLIESSVRADAKAEARAESRAELDVRVEPRVEPTPRPETRPSPSIDFGRERQDLTSIIDGRQSTDLETSDRFAPSLDALITGETADEEEFDFDQEFTGLETRPLREAEDIDEII